MNLYKIPDEFYFRIHHVRPRFKFDIENVLIYMAKAITAVGELPLADFVKEVNTAIYNYPGNAHLSEKTINNWRTEISALFGFIEHSEKTDRPGRRAIELSEREDLVECFKTFLYNFQYPGAHIKPKQVLEQIQAGIHFKPVQYILRLLRYANENGNNAFGLTKFEICHCIFNDLRVTRDNEGVEKTWARIVQNRTNNVEYVQFGDVVRYAGDIVDYMEIANLLKTYDNRTYYLNKLEEESIIKFCQSSEWFNGYDSMLAQRSGTIKAVRSCTNDWFAYVNRDMHNTDFSTDILAYIASNETELNILRKEIISESESSITSTLVNRENELNNRINTEYQNFTSKDIGDIGESLIHGHECMRLKLGNREDLIHLVKRIPSQYAIGYDINSVELNGLKRYIEVKTTISSKPIRFNQVHLTTNEWNTAQSNMDRYYVYRLLLTKTEKKLFLLQDPVGLYKKDLITMIPKDGADITFDPEQVGTFEELLTWTN